jgi:prepilin-type N-terminal cleavage/methylation domain-containing protein
MVARASQRGFTLVEMLVASAVAGVAIAAAFGFASFQVRGFAQQQDVSQMALTSRIINDTMMEDLRVAGFGTTFWAGTGQAAAFGNRVVVDDGGGQPLGVPALQVVDNVAGPVVGGAPAGNGVMVGSDAIMVLRVESESTNIPSSGPGQAGLTSVPGAGPIVVENGDRLARCVGANGSGLVLFSDMLRHGEPASMIQQVTAVGAGSPGTVTLANGVYGLDPGNAGNANGIMPATRAFGPGSLVTCVRVVTYWIDNLGRLRMWRSTPAAMATVGNLTGFLGIGGAQLPINVNDDVVLAEGVRNMQIALRASGEAPGALAGAWMFSDPANVLRPAATRMQAEARAVRVSVILSTPRVGDRRGGANTMPASLENNVLFDAAYPPTFTYRIESYVSELRNLRTFDLMSNANRDWNQIRSFPP